MKNLILNPAFRATSGTVEVRRNTVANPALTVDTSGWTSTMQASGAVSMSRVTTGGPTIAGAARSFFRMTVASVTTGALSSTGLIFGTPSADQITLTPGVANTLSVYTRSSVADRTASLVITSHTAAGANQVVEYSGPAVAIGGGWTRLSATFTPAAGQVRGYVRVYAAGGRVWQVGDTLEGTAALAEVSTVVRDYFDGTNAAAEGLTFAWTGAAGASASTATGAKPVDWTLSAPSSLYALPGGGARIVQTQASGWSAYPTALAVSPGETATVGYDLTLPASAPASVAFYARLRWYTSGGASITDAMGPDVVIAPGTTQRITLSATAPATAGGFRPLIGAVSGTSGVGPYDAHNALAVVGSTDSTYFDGATPGARWEGTADASRSLRPSLTATYDPALVRVGLQMEDFIDGSAVDITRDGEAVRGGTAILPSSGAYFVWDYEAPFNVAAYYEATDDTLTASAEATVPVTEAYLRAPGLPFLDMPILPREVPSISRPRETSVLRPIGRSRPVVLSGTRQAGEFTLNVWTRSQSEAATLQSLTEEAATVLLLMPGTRTVERVYIALGDAESAPLAHYRDVDPGASWVLWSVAATVVDSPVGDVYGDVTASYQAFDDAFASYTDLAATHPTYLSVLRGV